MLQIHTTRSISCTCCDSDGMNDEEEEAIVTIDGRGELGGYANYADNTVANATVADVIRTVQEMNTGAGNALDVAMIVVATVDIPAGREVRWDYDHTQDRPFRAAMLKRGITADELDSDAYGNGGVGNGG